MFTAGELAVSGLGMSALACFFGWRAGRAMLLSVGMLMLFNAWLQIINFDGGWPADQPPDESYIASKQEIARLDRLASTGTRPLSDAEWDDYHRCKQLNVCVRRFARSDWHD
jgi:hypothetical protein